jgi:hypothetical protein
MHSWNTFDAKTSHGQTRIHKIHHGPDLGEGTTFPLIIYSVPPWGPHPNGILSQDSQVGVPKFLEMGLPQLCGPITLCANLQLRWSLKQSYSPCREFFNGMFHVTCTWGNWGDSQLLVSGSQIANLTPDPSFGHNLCFRCPKWVMQTHFRHLCCKSFPMI